MASTANYFLWKTIFDAELAAKIGKPTADRAVGMANSLSHRVMATNAVLTGYTGGIERKRWLLNHEGVAIYQ
ncbi:methylated-DNA--[protein]-cysteine S-methyltransferase [Dendronalium sp. ChiSLP03b]|uniref:methylated-DNA--[protein]-cysteine S-methyltransferase n=1 Tax=Dendronalium sp. ChiSLP03b TaxID=3075381 RepID=UPI002AD1E048|nr:MGMT family protein [Dendronalium sp. ChiSLP03b]MDZ8207814.1 MGMT family protein [Dendronalium sp. ChiSLP03b]